jgi:TatD DNase family protein
MLIDIHCHINLYLNLQKVLDEAKNSGIEKIIAVSMSKISLKRIIELSNKYNMIYPALGIHPEEVKMNKAIQKQMNSILEYIKSNKDSICAIGEIGLDHHFIKNQELYPLQKTIFEKMLSLAQELQLPVNIHTKGAEKEIFDLLPSYNIPNINIHWYSGPEQYLALGIERGYFFSVTPAIMYSPAVKKVAEKVSVNNILLESDGPVKFSGQTGVPAMIKDVLIKLSQLKNVERDELERRIEQNTKEIFPKIF